VPNQAATRPIAIDLFCGAGGLSLGFEQAGFDVVTAVDVDPIHALTYQYNFPQAKVLCRDVSSVRGADLVNEARGHIESQGGSWSGEVDCVAGGPSCQGFSAIGGRDPDDPRNSLVLEFARIVAEVQPRCFVLENVPGLLRPAYEAIRGRVLSTLRESGFSFDDDPWLLDAYDFGVPQRRRRVFLVGVRGDLPRPVMPEGAEHLTAADAIGDLLAISRFPTQSNDDELVLSSVELAALEAAASPFAKRLRAAATSHDLAAPRKWDPALLTGALGTVHSDEVRTRLGSIPLGKREPQSRLPKLDPKKPSPTLRAGTGREHGSHTPVRPVHYSLPRVITVREAARLHAFPDWFRFHSTRWHALRQIGNSVPPPLGRAVASAMVAVLGATPVARAAIELGDVKGLSLSLGEAARELSVPASQLPPPRRRAA